MTFHGGFDILIKLSGSEALKRRSKPAAANLENDTEKREKSELSEREEARRETEGKSGRGASEEVRIL